MKRLIPLFIIFSCLTTVLFGQGQNCGNTIPIAVCPNDTVVCHTSLTDTLTLSMTSNLPNLEWGIVDLNKMATNGSGPAIVGVDADGSFIPNDFGIDTATMIEIIPLAYDLQAIQETLDDILKGTFSIFNIPCCTFATDVCNRLMAAGINCGSDFTSLEQAFTLIATDSTELLSVQDLVDGLDSVNMALADPAIPAECGGGDTICYAYGAPCTLDVRVIQPFLTLGAPLHTIDSLFTADTIVSTANIAPGIFIQYLFGSEVTLQSDFSVEVNGELIVSPDACD